MRGASGASSSTTAVSDVPYMMQEDEKMKRVTPACFASFASRIVPCQLISRVQALFKLPIGSLLSAAR